MYFREYLEAFGGFSYKVPADKQQQLYDFYMLQMLYGRSNSKYAGLNKAGVLAKGEVDFRDMDHDDKIDYMIQEVAEALVPAMKNELLQYVHYAVASEVRHVFSQSDLMKYKDRPPLTTAHRNVLNHYKRSFVLRRDPITSGDRQPVGDPSEFVGGEQSRRQTGYSQNPVRQASYEASLRASDGNPYQFMKMAHKLFTNVSWGENYGGSKWADVVSGWLRLYQSKTIPEMMIYIDHIYDLQHNTGTILNKSDAYKDSEGSYTWIEKALNHKAQIKSPHEFLRYVSPSMRRLALPAIRAKFGTSLEEFDELPDLARQNDVVFSIRQMDGGKNDDLALRVARTAIRLHSKYKIRRPLEFAMAWHKSASVHLSDVPSIDEIRRLVIREQDIMKVLEEVGKGLAGNGEAHELLQRAAANFPDIDADTKRDLETMRLYQLYDRLPYSHELVHHLGTIWSYLSAYNSDLQVDPNGSLVDNKRKIVAIMHGRGQAAAEKALKSLLASSDFDYKEVWDSIEDEFQGLKYWLAVPNNKPSHEIWKSATQRRLANGLLPELSKEEWQKIFDRLDLEGMEKAFKSITYWPDQAVRSAVRFIRQVQP